MCCATGGKRVFPAQLHVVGYVNCPVPTGRIDDAARTCFAIWAFLRSLYIFWISSSGGDLYVLRRSTLPKRDGGFGGGSFIALSLRSHIAASRLA